MFRELAQMHRGLDQLVQVAAKMWICVPEAFQVIIFHLVPE